MYMVKLPCGNAIPRIGVRHFRLELESGAAFGHAPVHCEDSPAAWQVSHTSGAALDLEPKPLPEIVSVLPLAELPLTPEIAGALMAGAAITSMPVRSEAAN